VITSENERYFVGRVLPITNAAGKSAKSRKSCKTKHRRNTSHQTQKIASQQHSAKTSASNFDDANYIPDVCILHRLNIGSTQNSQRQSTTTAYDPPACRRVAAHDHHLITLLKPTPPPLTKEDRTSNTTQKPTEKNTENNHLKQTRLNKNRTSPKKFNEPTAAETSQCQKTTDLQKNCSATTARR
jgi:hypothetical protein